MTEKLKPCPFCGGEAKPVFRGGVNYVVCSNEEDCWCGMTCPVTTPEEAARIWNRRTNAKELVARLNVSDEQVRRMVDEAVSAAWNRRAIDRDELLKIAEELEAGYGCRLDEYHSVAQFAENAHEYERGIAYLIREAVGE